MSDTGQPAGDRARDPFLAAAIDDIKPYAAAVGAVSLLGLPADVGTPIVRRLRGQSGASLGPGLVNFANGVAVLGLVRLVRQRPALWQRWKHQRIPRWARITGLVHVTASPFAAAGWRWPVVLRSRSPLWGGLLSPIGLLQIALLRLAFHRARQARTAATGGQSDGADGPACDGSSGTARHTRQHGRRRTPEGL